MTTLTVTISGDTPAFVLLETLLRRDSGQAVVLSPPLPQAFTGSAGSYTFTFADPAGDCARGYAYSFEITWTDGSIDGPYNANAAGGGSSPALIDGPVAIAIDGLRTLIANVPFFQTWTGTNATTALGRIFVGEVGYPIASAEIAAGVLTLHTREPHEISAGDTITIAGASTGPESSLSIDGPQLVTTASGDLLTIATDLPDTAGTSALNPDFAFVLPCARPLAVVSDAADALHSESIGTGGASIFAGTLELLLEADVSAPFANSSANALTEARTTFGQFVAGLMYTQGTADFICLNKCEPVTGPEFTHHAEQDDNSIRFERWRALLKVTWGLEG